MFNVFSAFWNSKRLIATWTRYNIESDYLDTKLGAVWIALQPILMTLIYSAVFSLLLNRAPRGGVPYVSFFLSGMILWHFISNTLTQASTLVAAKANLISQIKFPREALIFVLFMEKLVDFVVAFVILVLLNFFYGFYPSWYYLYVPIVLATLFAISLGAMFLLSTIGVFVQDIPQIVSVALRFLFYFSGVLISSDMLPEKVAKYLNFNPFFFLIETFRNLVLYEEAPNIMFLLAWLGGGIIVLVVGFYIFKSQDGSFADYK